MIGNSFVLENGRVYLGQVMVKLGYKSAKLSLKHLGQGCWFFEKFEKFGLGERK